MSDVSSPPPEQAAGGPVFTLSPWSKRVLAALTDAAPVVALIFFGAIVDGDGGGIFLLCYLASLGFMVWNLIRQGRTGQTVGKSVLNIKLLKEADAALVGATLSIGRSVLHILDALPCFVGYLNPLWDAKRQTFADKILATVVVDVT